MTFPTATDSLLGNGKWSAGPALVLLAMPGHWVFGALANNQWSFAGWGKNNMNAMLIQPFLNYNFPPWLVFHLIADHYSELVGRQHRPLDRPDRRRYRQAFQAR
jgi:hypothetical protein